MLTIVSRSPGHLAGRNQRVGAILDDSDFYPFGVERPVVSSSGDTSNLASKERDTESNLDNFGARYMSSSMGRFMSVDPIMLKRNRVENPQRLNLYDYDVNDPLRFVDPDGRDPLDYVKGIGQGLNNFVNHAYFTIVAAAKDPLTPVHGLVNAVSIALTAYGTAQGRSALVSQFKALSTQEKTAVVTEALAAGGVGGVAKVQASGRCGNWIVQRCARGPWRSAVSSEYCQ